MLSVLASIYLSYSALHRQMSPLYRRLESLGPAGLGICNKNASGELTSVIMELDGAFIRRPIAIFNSWPSRAKKPAPSFVLANVLCILRKGYRNTLNYGVNISDFLNFFSYTQICFHNQCPRALIDLVDNYHSISVNTCFLFIFKGFFALLECFLPYTQPSCLLVFIRACILHVWQYISIYEGRKNEISNMLFYRTFGCIYVVRLRDV